MLLLTVGSIHATRYQSLANAKHLTLTTTKGVTYYYMIGSDMPAVMRLNDRQVIVRRDTFLLDDIKSMRLKTIPRFVLDEDSTTYGRDYEVSHALLALHRTLNLGQWNSIVLPVELTGSQIRDAFGDDAAVAQIKDITHGDQVVVNYETIDLYTDDVVMEANYHYIIRPTREADVTTGQASQLFGGVKPKAPLYLIADVSMDVKQSPKVQTLRTDDRVVMLSLQGSYVKREGSNMLQSGIYYLNDESTFEEAHEAFSLTGFRSFLLPLTTLPSTLHFLIDGVETTDISDTLIDDGDMRTEKAFYDLQGRRIASQPQTDSRPLLNKGIYIIRSANGHLQGKNGKKVIVK